MKYAMLAVMSCFVALNAFAEAKWERRISEVEARLDAQASPYEVYDAGGRLVGTTVDGVNVRAVFEGHDDVVFVIRAGASDDPDYNNSLGILYQGLGCSGPPYLMGEGTDPMYPVMEGVRVTVDEIGRLQSGDYVYGDPYALAIPFDNNVSIYSSAGSQCLDFPGQPPIIVTGVPAIVIDIDWAPPLSIVPPK